MFCGDKILCSEFNEIRKEGKHYEKPADCPQEIYELLQLCWAEDPSKRFLNHHLFYENRISLLELKSKIESMCTKYQFVPKPIEIAPMEKKFNLLMEFSTTVNPILLLLIPL
jgi:hypothetical protein